MQKMHNGVQNYAWGSKDALTELYGITDPQGRPMAELWMGAHPKSSSQVENAAGEKISLREQISANLDEQLGKKVAKRFGVFGATLITFFLAEMGDKTQIATIAMAAHYADPLLVVIGTTLGMLIADVPAVFVGDKLANKIPMKLVHSVAAAVFAVLGVATLLGAGAGFGF